ncbi:MAG: sulfotransferase [Deinococcales bacterium]
MQAYELIIDAKVNDYPFDIVSAANFRTHKGDTLDPQIVLDQPNISLYCLDHANKQAIFVKTALEIDLLKEPFYFFAQYEAAESLIAVPYDTLHELAQKVEIDPQRIILLYSTGRCGSTLFSHVLNLNERLISFSEPDVFSQLVMLRTSQQASDGQIRELLHDSLMVMCGNAQQQGFERYAFKFRSYVLSLSDLLYQAVPEAKLIFMYRHALTWARSFSRAFGAADDQKLQEQLSRGFRYMIPGVHHHLTQQGQITWPEYLAHMWVSTMQDSRWLLAQGARLACVRYEDLKADPRAVFETSLRHCGLAMPDGGLELTLATDSQKGTAGAQDKKPARALTEGDLRELEHLIQQLDPQLTPHTRLS